VSAVEEVRVYLSHGVKCGSDARHGDPPTMALPPGTRATGREAAHLPSENVDSTSLAGELIALIAVLIVDGKMLRRAAVVENDTTARHFVESRVRQFK
jgi:hypothetical protein